MTVASTWRLVRLADAVATPWRNGGGLTRELLAGPDAGDWQWRLSVADVTKDGPFSVFPGVLRWFAVLDGAGVRLSFDGVTHELDARCAPIFFGGAVPVECELVGGPTRDFNLMVRSGTPRLERVAQRRSTRVRSSHFVAAYAHSSGARLGWGAESVELPPETLAWRPGEAQADALVAMELVGEDVLWMEIAP